MRIRRNRMLSGSYTVEAAILFPLLTMILISVFYLSLLLYNRVVLQVAAIRGAQQIHYMPGESDQTILSNCESVVRGQIDSRCMGIDNIQSQISVGEKESKVVLETNQQVVHFLPGNMAENDFWSIEAEWGSEKKHPAELFRKTRKYLLYWQLLQEQIVEKEK